MRIPKTEKATRSETCAWDRWVSFSMSLGRGKKKTWVIATDKGESPRSDWHWIIAQQRRYVNTHGLPQRTWTYTNRQFREPGGWFVLLGGTTWGYTNTRPFSSIQIQRECDPETPLFIVVTKHMYKPHKDPRLKYIEFGNGGALPHELEADLNNYSTLCFF